jgi:hypothetical protein
VRLVAAALGATLLATFVTALPARAQEFDEGAEVTDSLFTQPIQYPLNYTSYYNHDKSRGGWTQSLDYSRTWKNLAMNVSGSTGTSEDVLKSGSRSTNGDLLGRLDWRATTRLILSVDGRSAMSSIADGVRASNSDQRRNTLSLNGQYRVPLRATGSFVLIGSTGFQRDYDRRTADVVVQGASLTAPDSVRYDNDSSFVSGRLDAIRGQLRLPILPGIFFRGGAYGSRNRLTTHVQTLRFRTPLDGSPSTEFIDVRRVKLPADNAFLDGELSVDGIPRTKLVLKSRRSGIDRVYFDLAQLQVEQYSNDGREYIFNGTMTPSSGFVLTTVASVKRTLQEYMVRPNLNSLVIARGVSTGAGYTSVARDITVNLDVSRVRAERQSTANGLTIARTLTTNLKQRLFGRLWLVGLGSASLFSYQYLLPDSLKGVKEFSVDDRDVATAFGSVGARLGITPRCSTAVSFSVSRVKAVSIDSTRSAGNFATTVYQINGSLRLPLHRNLSIGQDYIMTATTRTFDYDESRDDLSRNFRIDTTVADTLFPFAYVRLDHRYYAFDQGEFTPVEAGGSRFYGVASEQDQQVLEGTIGVRPLAGITFVVKQSLSDTDNRDVVGNRVVETDQWNLSLGLELNRSFWNGAGLSGAVRRESKYQNIGTVIGSTQKENHWLAAITFLKEF